MIEKSGVKRSKKMLAHILLATVLLTTLLQPVFAFAQTSERLREGAGSLGAAPVPEGQEATDPAVRAAQAEAAATELIGPAVDPNDVKAQGCGWLSLGFACPIYWILDTLSDLITTALVSLASLIFGAFVKIAFFDLGTTTFVKMGYGITLGVANMFFVLILLWIAIATALNYEEYHAKTLLPKLIIAALFINFSLPIANSFIKLSNGIANIFYEELKRPLTAAEARQISGSLAGLIATPIAARVMLMSKFAALKNTKPTSDSAREELVRRVREGNCRYIRDTTGAGGFSSEVSNVGCDNDAAQAAWDEFNRVPEDASGSLAGGFISIFWKLIITPVLIFVLLAGSLFILIRQLSLAFVLVLGPLAFLFMILPKTQTYYNEWWDKLFKWSFFFPAYMFFLFLSLKVGSGLLPAAAGNQNDKLPLMMQYFLTVGLLIGSLIVANKMGIQFAGAVNGWGKKIAGKAGGWVKDRGWKYAGKATGAALSKFPRLNKFVGGKVGAVLGARAAATAVMKKGEAVEQKDAAFYTKLSNRNLATALDGMSPKLQATIFRALPKSRQNNPDLARFNPDAEPAAAGVTPEQARTQAVQKRVLSALGNTIADLPENMREATSQAIREAIAGEPDGASPEDIARAVQRAFRGATTGSGMEANIDRPNVVQQIQNAVTQGRQQGAGRAAGARATAGMSPEEIDERFEQFQSRISELEEKEKK